MKKLLTIFLAIFLVIALVGCSTPTTTDTTDTSQDSTDTSTSDTEDTSSSDSSSTTSEEVTLTFVTISGVLADAANYAAQTFTEKYPNITVNVVEQPADSYYNNGYQVLTASGGTYDLAFYWRNTIWPDMANGGVFLPLDELYESQDWASVVGQPVADLYMGDDGHYYSICDNFVWVGNVFYNKEIFEEQNLQVPTTIEEFETVCEALKTAGYIPLSVPAEGGWFEHLFDTLMVRYLTTEQYAKICDGTTKYEDMNYESPEMLQVFSEIKKFAENGYFQEGAGQYEPNGC